MNKTTIGKLKKGEYFKLSESDTAPVWVRGEYERSEKKYLLILNFRVMSRIYDYLQKQLKSEEHRKDAEDCLKIYEKLKDISKGCV